MEHPPAEQSQVGSNPCRASPASLSEHCSDVDSARDDKGQSSANTTVNSSENTNDRSIRSAIKASLGKTLSKILGKQARPGTSLDVKPPLGPDAASKKKSDFAKRWDKRFDELLKRSDPLELQPSKSVTDINVTSSEHGKNKGLLKRRSLGNIFGSVRSRNTLKKGSKPPEALTDKMGSSLSTQSLAKDPTTLDSAPPILPHLAPSGDLRSSIQVNLGPDPERSSIDPSEQLRSSTPTRPHRRDQAVQTPLTSMAEHADAKGKGTCDLPLPGMVDIHTGHELVWNTSTNLDALSVPKCNTLASGPIANAHSGQTGPDRLVCVSPANEAMDSTHTKRRDLQIPRIGSHQEVRHSLKGNQVHIYSDKKIYWIPEAKNQSMVEAFTGASTDRNDAVNRAAAGKGNENSDTVGTDITNMPSNSGIKKLKGKAKSLTFVRQLEIQPRGSSLTAPRRISFEMDLRGTDSSQGDAKSSLHGHLDDDDDAAVNTEKDK
ncbi:hypothetical protein LX36DRAFT_669173 [Colletotrichum falcatum]|nr:hypothetical protein LX36DRAFT_669173 [Colletotrichum falcatum]